MRALMISRDVQLHDEIAAQGAARMPVLRIAGAPQRLARRRRAHAARGARTGDRRRQRHRRRRGRPARTPGAPVSGGRADAAHARPAAGCADPRDARRHARSAAAAAGAQGLPRGDGPGRYPGRRDANARRQGTGLYLLQGRQRRHLPVDQFCLCAGRAGRLQGAADRPARPVRRRHPVCVGPEAGHDACPISARRSRAWTAPSWRPAWCM